MCPSYYKYYTKRGLRRLRSILPFVNFASLNSQNKSFLFRVIWNETSRSFATLQLFFRCNRVAFAATRPNCQNFKRTAKDEKAIPKISPDCFALNRLNLNSGSWKRPNPERKVRLQIKQYLGWKVTGSKLGATKDFSLLKSTLALVICMHNINSCVRRIGWQHIFFTQSKFNLSSIS